MTLEKFKYLICRGISKLSWNATALSKSDCRNFLGKSSITFLHNGNYKISQFDTTVQSKMHDVIFLIINDNAENMAANCYINSQFHSHNLG